MSLPSYTPLHYKIWHYTYLTICGLVFFFLIAPLFVISFSTVTVPPEFTVNVFPEFTVQLQVSKIRKKRSKSRNPKPVSPLGILMLLNKKLPQKVQQNMGLPGLANRTGRFAASVQAVNIQDSKLGVPMIDYTYQKNPYQVFETSRGQRPWSSLERDPRTLIDESIRELAAEMALGKFTTRRV